MSDFESHQDDYEPDGQPDDLPAPDAEDAPDDTGQPESASTSDQLAEEPDSSEIEQIEKEREERLDSDNRPDNVEVDNTQRTFDPEKGMFTDQDGYEEAEKVFPPVGEQGV